MQAKDIIKDIKSAVDQVKDQGQEVISVSALKRYLEELERIVDTQKEISTTQLESQLATFRAEHERNLAHYEAQQKHSIEMLRSVFMFGNTALKSSILINGGAAVALLAFIGKIWTDKLEAAAISAVTMAIAFFSFGVLSAAVGTAFSYLTQYAYSQRLTKTGIVFHIATFLLVVGSYIFFGVATYKAYITFVVHLK